MGGLRNTCRARARRTRRRDEAVRAWLEAAWHERRAAIRAWLPLANAALAVIDELARGKAALTAAETAEDLDAAIAGCERVRDHVASLRRQLRLREELEILRRDNDRLKRPADAPAVEAIAEPPKKSRKVSSPTNTTSASFRVVDAAGAQVRKSTDYNYSKMVAHLAFGQIVLVTHSFGVTRPQARIVDPCDGWVDLAALETVPQPSIPSG